MKKNKKNYLHNKNAFTLAEVMITMTIVGVLSAILVPIAFHSSPNENVVKFKKGNDTLFKVISELVSNEKYYTNGDLGVKANGDNVSETDYFCHSFSDILTTKQVLCSSATPATPSDSNTDVIKESNFDDYETFQEEFDKQCKEKESSIDNKIQTIDKIYYYELNPQDPFGAIADPKIGFNNSFNNQYYEVWNHKSASDNNNFKSGFYFTYKPFCMDIDEINNGEDPFGYGIRVDGKIVLGKKATEWNEKPILKQK